MRPHISTKECEEKSQQRKIGFCNILPKDSKAADLFFTVLLTLLLPVKFLEITFFYLVGGFFIVNLITLVEFSKISVSHVNFPRFAAAERNCNFPIRHLSDFCQLPR